MKYFLSLFLLIAGLNNTVLAQGRGSGEKVNITSQKIKNGFYVIAHNRNPYSVTLTLSVSGENYDVDRPLPLTTVIPAGNSKNLLTVQIRDKSGSFKFDNQYTWFIGNIHASHDDSYVYQLPFEKGAAYEVGQANNGSFSHRGKSRYAIDFIMPVGTEVVAAREGVVTQIREDSDRGGKSDIYKRDSNFIVVEHSDGTLGEYAHLKKGGVLVEPGERIKKGQVIGLSGNTGFSSGPHLHFMVTKVLPDGHSQSLPIRFRTEHGVTGNLEKGEWYTAY